MTRYTCPRCGVDHLEPPFSFTPPPAVIVMEGPHAGKMGVAVEWRRYDSPAWVRVVIGVDDRGFEVRETFQPCQIWAWQARLSPRQRPSIDVCRRASTHGVVVLDGVCKVCRER